MFKKINENVGVFALVTLALSLSGVIFAQDWVRYVAIVLLIVLVIFLLALKFSPMKFSNVQEKARILFVDDKDCEITKNLRLNNFEVRKIDDVDSPTNDKDVLWANIIFVDYKGVGKKLFQGKEGLGLLAELKRVHGKKKRYVIYSTIQNFDGLVEYPFIRKNATYSEYISLITDEVSKL